MLAAVPGPATPKVGDVIEGRYRILDTLGEGGMGTVFLAEHTMIKRRVAIKILHAELATDADVIDRFLNEARAAGTLGHPNIVESTDMGFTGAHVPYIAFEHLEGALLTAEIYRVGGMPVRRAVRIAAQIASALDAAHHAGVVHRDLKSDNVFLTDKDDALDHVKVLDFGISRFQEAPDRQKGMVIGTPEYMAPEQITAPEHVDGRADVYALGVILYEMLAARRPFAADGDPQTLVARIVGEAAPPLDRAEVPHGLVEIIERMMAKDPDARYQTMADVLAALELFTTLVSGGEDSDLLGSARGARGSGPIARPTRLKSVPGAIAGAGAAVAKAAKQVALPKPGMTRPAAGLYVMAVGGALAGAIGVIFGLTRGGHEAAAARPPARAIAATAATIAVELDADVPGATIAFRHDVTVAPERLQLAPLDVPELVEVAAPGHQTLRYWVTFDRPVHLHAHLVPGDGTAEATDAEIMAATR